jgi:hypothetical protein
LHCSSGRRLCLSVVKVGAVTSRHCRRSDQCDILERSAFRRLTVLHPSSVTVSALYQLRLLGLLSSFPIFDRQGHELPPVRAGSVDNIETDTNCPTGEASTSRAGLTLADTSSRFNAGWSPCSAFLLNRTRRELESTQRISDMCESIYSWFDVRSLCTA